MYSQRAIHFEEIEMLVLDEVDRMLDMGFIDDINKILSRLQMIFKACCFLRPYLTKYVT